MEIFCMKSASASGDLQILPRQTNNTLTIKLFAKIREGTAKKSVVAEFEDWVQAEDPNTFPADQRRENTR